MNACLLILSLTSPSLHPLTEEDQERQEADEDQEEGDFDQCRR